ncbi:hypothetical protein HUJ04_011853 [Dendroctonus ponderosae]|nr:hypothetical protein HUJ04_011853 [Dendroctonus ponderosae]
MKSLTSLSIFLVCLASFGQGQLSFDIRVPQVADILNRVSNTTFGIIRGSINFVGRAVDRVINTFGRVEDRLRALLEEFRGIILRGIPELNIPVLDPLHVNKVDFDVNHEAARFKLDLNLTFPYIKVTGNYKIDGKVGRGFVIYGDGPFW